MSSNEIKNRAHAIGLFAPVPALPFTTPIVSAVGFDSFTRNGPGSYTVALQDAAQFSTHAVGVNMGANVLGTIGGQIAPDGASVLVTAFDALGVPFDPSHFDLRVDTIRSGVGVGPAPAFPAVPAPPAFGAGLLLGWARIASTGAVINEAPVGIVANVAHPGAGVFNITTDTGGLLAAHMATILAGGTFFIGTNNVGPDDMQVTIFDAAGAADDENFTVTFYRL